MFVALMEMWQKEVQLSGLKEQISQLKSDPEGYFEMHLIPGTYTLSCKREFDEDKWTETLKNLNLKLNEKTEVEFILGIKVE